MPELPFKDINFRIYRDIRFSNDPTPYKVSNLFPYLITPRRHPFFLSFYFILNCFLIFKKRKS